MMSYGMSYECELVEERLGARDVAAAIDVDHDLRPRPVAAPRIDAVDARVDELRELVPVLRQLAVRPHHAVDDLVADLHHLRQHAGVAERRDRCRACTRTPPARAPGVTFPATLSESAASPGRPSHRRSDSPAGTSCRASSRPARARSCRRDRSAARSACETGAAAPSRSHGRCRICRPGFATPPSLNTTPCCSACRRNETSAPTA